VLLTTPPALERAFAAQGVVLARRASPPQLCDARGCNGLEVWGDGAAPVYLVPRRGKPDFEVIVFRRPQDAAKVARLYRRNTAVGSKTRSNALLLYLRSTPRVARLLAAFG
jgi:hypothetical protein